jgi:hypothetical protein
MISPPWSIRWRVTVPPRIGGPNKTRATSPAIGQHFHNEKGGDPFGVATLCVSTGTLPVVPVAETCVLSAGQEAERIRFRL